MVTHKVVWSESQRKIILRALDLCLKRLSSFLKSADENVVERDKDYRRLSTLLASQKPDKDGMFRIALDEDSAALIKTAVVSCSAELK